MISKVAVICPMKNEYDALKRIIGTGGENICRGRTVSFLEDQNIHLTAIHAGMGKINCASATQLAIEHFECDTLIDSGAAGALCDSLDISDVFLSLTSYEYDIFPIEKLTEKFKRLKEIAASHTHFSTDEFKKCASAQKIINAFRESFKSNYARELFFGDCACGEKDVNDKNLRERLYKSCGAMICNWETSAVLKIANLSNVRAYSFRAISDMASDSMKAEYRKNVQNALETLYSSLKIFIFDGFLNGLAATSSPQA